MKYILMHREKETAEIELDELSHIAAVGRVFDAEHLPLGTRRGEGADKTALARWWATRSIPASRSGIKEALMKLNMTVPQELLDKCWGLSLSDQYWINPVEKPLRWAEINFFDNAFSEDVGNLLFAGAELSEEMSLVSPDNTSDGQLVKKWKIAGEKRVLIKGSGRPYYQEALCEVIASRIAGRLDIPHVEYSLIYDEGKPMSVCEDFVTRDTELVSAYHIMRSAAKPNDMSEYEFYIKLCEKFGVADIRECVEKMITLDFIIANEDRHFNNFGLMREAESLKWIGAAPLFDCGTSLWYNTQEKNIMPLSPKLLSKPFKNTHSEQIKLVKDFSWIDFTRLEGVVEEARAIFDEAPEISDVRRDALCEGLRERIELLCEYCKNRR